MTSRLLPLVVVLPLAAGFLAAWAGRKNIALVRAGAIAVSVAHAAISLALLAAASRSGPLVHLMGGWAAPVGIELRLDLFGAVVLFLIGGLNSLVMVYASRDAAEETAPGVEPWYWSLLLVLLGAMSGIAVTKDLFNLFVMTEVSSIAACGIVAVSRRPAALEASFKYLILSAVGSGAILLGTGLLYAATGYLDIDRVSEVLREVAGSFPRVTMAALALYLVGFGLKAALFPLHVWLPDAHSTAPSPSSALLSGLVVKVYVVALVRLLYQVWGVELFSQSPGPTVLLLLSWLAMVLGSVFAIAQRDLKRMLAYSTVSQMGYIFLGLALASPNALAGGLLHIFNHALMKSCLFLAAGVLISRAGTRDIAAMAGIGRAMPLTTAAFTVAAMAMIGVPGTNGFISKWYLSLGALDLGRPVHVAVVIFSSLLNGVYYLPFVISAFFGAGHYEKRVTEAPGVLLGPVLILAAACIWTGLFPRFPLDQLISAAHGFLGR